MSIKMDTMDDVRAVLIAQIQKLDDKTTTPSVANAIFNGVGRILTTVKTEIEYSRYVKKLEGAMPLQIESKKR